MQSITPGEFVQIVGAFIILVWALRTATRWSQAGLGGAFEGIGAFLLVFGFISLFGPEIVDFGYTEFRSDLPETNMVKDAEAVLNSGVGLVAEQPEAGWLSSGESEGPRDIGPSWDRPEQKPTPVPSQGQEEQPTSEPEATEEPKAQVTPEPEEQLIQDPDELAACWREQALKDGLASAVGGGTTWFPAGVACSISEQKRFGPPLIGGRNYWFVTCPDLQVRDLRVTHQLGKQLKKAAGPSGTFYGAGSWPPACYVQEGTATAGPAPVNDEPSTFCPEGKEIPANTAGFYVEVGGQMQVVGGFYPSETTLTGKSRVLGDFILCQTSDYLNGDQVWIWFPEG
jgi:hypothetical protein